MKDWLAAGVLRGTTGLTAFLGYRLVMEWVARLHPVLARPFVAVVVLWGAVAVVWISRDVWM